MRVDTFLSSPFGILVFARVSSRFSSSPRAFAPFTCFPLDVHLSMIACLPHKKRNEPQSQRDSSSGKKIFKNELSDWSLLRVCDLTTLHDLMPP